MFERNDCGVWVAQWQLMSYVWEDYLVEVNMQTRMRLALDLVIGPHNPKSKEVEELAIKVWDKKVSAAASRQNGRKRTVEKTRSPSPSLSF
ncbi:hypothetical protein PIB30_056041 [Stylosanthes scabra]|uniref:Uncharacterized protein n=1 Tax=Stylosanthes scabra TaxID=79078 RepID=A0ABU6WHT5_9FABA|nr:hypothetical protein [Stylosanthes scabra]